MPPTRESAPSPRLDSSLEKINPRFDPDLPALSPLPSLSPSASSATGSVRALAALTVVVGGSVGGVVGLVLHRHSLLVSSTTSPEIDSC
jgi:hypothetical protein